MALTSKLTAIADAIREQNGTDDGLTLDDMPGAILAIEGAASSAGAVSEGVEFVNLHGDILYSYSWDDVAELAELPAGQDITAEADGITCELDFDSWGWSLESLQSYTGGGLVTVGATYAPADGKTHVVLDLPGEVSDVTANLYLVWDGTGTVTIDWGDGETDDLTSTSATIYSHTYDAPDGAHDITIACADGGTWYPYGTSTYSMVCSQMSAGAYYTTTELRAFWGASGCSQISAYAFRCCFSLTGVALPDGVTSIGGSAFYNCYGLTGVALPDGVTSIGDYAFYYCYSLAGVALPDGVTSIGGYVFRNCRGLAGVALPDGVTGVGTYAFYNCYGLSTLVLPAGVTTVPGSCFYHSGLASLTLEATEVVTLSDTSAFTGTPIEAGTGAIYVPSDLVDAYKDATNWSTYADCIYAIGE